jgi:Endomembrane protein 70
VPFTTFASLLLMWFGVSAPLVLLGSYWGLKAEPFNIPVRVNQVSSSYYILLTLITAALAAVAVTTTANTITDSATVTIMLVLLALCCCCYCQHY